MIWAVCISRMTKWVPGKRSENDCTNKGKMYGANVGITPRVNVPCSDSVSEDTQALSWSTSCRIWRILMMICSPAGVGAMGLD